MAGKITDLDDPPLSPLSTDLMEIVQNGVNYKLPIGNLPQPDPASGAAVRVNVNSFSGATITDKLQNAVNSGEPIAMPAGLHTLDGPITIPTAGMDIVGAGDGLRMNGGTILRSGNGDDIFSRAYTNAAQARPGGQNQITIAHMGMRLRPNGANTRSSFERATVTGYGIGQSAIALSRGDWPTETTGTRSISDAWLSSHGRYSHITVDVENGSSVDHGCSALNYQGCSYGSRWEHIDSGGGQSSTRRGTASLITMGVPYLHRVTADAGTDRINTSGTNEFLNNQKVMVRAHDLTGTQPGGIDFDTEYHVINRTGSSFQLSTTQGGGAINITSNGSGFIYALLVNKAGAEYAPDECYINACSHYNPELVISIPNSERLYVGNITSYAAGVVLEIPGFVSNNRTKAITTTVVSCYSESPQAQQGLSNSSCVEINSDGLFMASFQMRGADTGAKPIVKFLGNDHTIYSFDGRSSFSQGGIDFRMEAVNSLVFGQCHDTSTVSVLSDTVGRLRRAGGSGSFFARNFT